MIRAVLGCEWSHCASATLHLVLAAVLFTASSAAAQTDAGERALARYGCASCHELGGPRVAEGASCVGCHQRIVSAPRSGIGRAPRVEHYVHAPDLRHIARRLRTDYLARFVRDPHDVRSRLEETMPRLPVTSEDARAIAGYLERIAGDVAVPASPPPNPGNVARGREVFARSGCPNCHERGNQDFGVRFTPAVLASLPQPAIEAPNLRFVRDRVEPDVALAWILEPRSIDPNTQMPDLGLSAADALAVRDFLFLGDAGTPVAPPAAPSASALTPVSRRVRYDDVRAIFQRSCIHCHTHTDARSASALGFEPTSLDLSSAEGVRAGVLLPDGSRRSVIAPDESGVPPLLGRLLRRHEESARDVVTPGHDPLAPVARAVPEEPPGMPLGLPPVGVEDLRLVATWIASGAPR